MRAGAAADCQQTCPPCYKTCSASAKQLKMRRFTKFESSAIANYFQLQPVLRVALEEVN